MSDELENLDEELEKDLPGVVAEFGTLGPGAVVTEAGLAKLFHRHPISIKRAVARGELPPPVRLFGQPVWTIKSLVNHLETRLAEAAVDEAVVRTHLRALPSRKN
jgi:hypothetical protein